MEDSQITRDGRKAEKTKKEAIKKDLAINEFMI
jgi:hypothetical protein